MRKIRIVERIFKSRRTLEGAGVPLKEPVAWGGPIVMNTQAELELAFRELSNGTFIRK